MKAACIVEGIGAIIIGWTVSRLHRPYSMPMVLVYVATVQLLDLGGFFNSFQRGLSRVRRHGPGHQLGISAVLATNRSPTL
jgi:hypothetical protein